MNKNERLKMLVNCGKHNPSLKGTRCALESFAYFKESLKCSISDPKYKDSMEILNYLDNIHNRRSVAVEDLAESEDDIDRIALKLELQGIKNIDTYCTEDDIMLNQLSSNVKREIEVNLKIQSNDNDT